MEVLAQIKFSSIAKIQIYQNTSRLTMAQIKAKTGADYIINGGIYNFSTFKPYGNIKINGKVIYNPGYGEFGLSWDTNKPIYQKIPCATQNYIGCVSMIQNGSKQSLTYNKDMGGIRQRSAIGIKGNSLMIYACNGTNSKSPETLQSYCYNNGWTGALMLDGGGSTQANLNGKVLNSAENGGKGRIVQNYILVFLNKITPTATTTTKCPYAEPTVLIKSGSTGEGAKWVQWQLNRILNSGLVVDGIFGAKSVTALKSFQTKYNLSVDGICGAQTRQKMKSV